MTSECHQMLAGLDSRNFAPPIRQILAGTQSGANRARSHTPSIMSRRIVPIALGRLELTPSVN
jgi:hypothetical protein